MPELRSATAIRSGDIVLARVEGVGRVYAQVTGAERQLMLPILPFDRSVPSRLVPVRDVIDHWRKMRRRPRG